MSDAYKEMNEALEKEALEAIQKLGLTRFRVSELKRAMPRMDNVIRNALDRLVTLGKLKTETQTGHGFRSTGGGPGSGKSSMTTTKKKFYIVV